MNNQPCITCDMNFTTPNWALFMLLVVIFFVSPSLTKRIYEYIAAKTDKTSIS